MGLFRKKLDPISERARSLNDQIAALEAEIQKLAEQKEEPPAPPSPSPFRASAPTPPSSQPRLRSTARPHGLNVPAATPAPEPIFEEVDQERISSEEEAPVPQPEQELGVRKNDFASTWQRFKNHFRGPAASNPKLVSYLAAGSIQGLRPLRYEKRVARNRFIVLAVFLVLALWGLIAIFVSRR